MRTYQVTAGRGFRIAGELLSALRSGVSRDYMSFAMEVRRRRHRALEYIRVHYGLEWEGMRLLELGSGQRCVWSQAFGARNHVSAVDLDVVPRPGVDLQAYRSILSRNGPYRLGKTVARKLLGVDRMERAALRRAFGEHLPWPLTHRMDAGCLTFGNDVFDGAFSFSVFEHLPEPRTALRELSRVVRPGGVIYIELELFTSIKGMHDPRLWARVDALPYWAHLRVRHQDRCAANVFINRWRMGQYIEALEQELDCTHVLRHENGTRAYWRQLSALERQELSAFTDEELCTQDLVMMGLARPSTGFS